MSRYKFQLGKTYAGRLIRVTKRPLENDEDAQIWLLRLEFEIFQIDQSAQVLHALDWVASRDVVIGPGLRKANTTRVKEYARILKIKDVRDVAAWVQAGLGGVRSRTWSAIVFGPMDDTDFRNPFLSIQPFDVRGYQIRSRGNARPTDWASVSTVARELRTSHSTLRRRLLVLAELAPGKLVKSTRGGHRRINLPLLRNMWTQNSR